MVSFDLSVTTTNIGAGYDDIQRMLNGVTLFFRRNGIINSFRMFSNE